MTKKDNETEAMRLTQIKTHLCQAGYEIDEAIKLLTAMEIKAINRLFAPEIEREEENDKEKTNNVSQEAQLEIGLGRKSKDTSCYG